MHTHDVFVEDLEMENFPSTRTLDADNINTSHL